MTAPDDSQAVAVVTPTTSQDKDGPDVVHVTFPSAEVQQLHAVLPWLVQALEERPNLTAKQRQRRRVSREALSALLLRIGGTLPAPRTAEMAEAGA